MNQKFNRLIGASFALALSFFANIANAQEPTSSSLSIGAIRDQTESSAVRILAKYGDSLSVTDKISALGMNGDRGTFYNISREFKIDAADKGQFGGASFRYGIKQYNIGLKTDPHAPPRDDGKPVIKFDGDKWMHIFPIYIGADTDRNFKNKDYLVEAGYIPALFKQGDSCFKLGGNPIVGIGGQLGHRIRSNDPTANGQRPEASGSLRRLKIEGKMEFPLSCVLNIHSSQSTDGSNPFSLILSDIGNWQVIASATGWRDFSEDRTYKKYELTIRIPTNANSFIDFKRDIGAAPTNFDTGAKFSANLTIQF